MEREEIMSKGEGEKINIRDGETETLTREGELVSVSVIRRLRSHAL